MGRLGRRVTAGALLAALVVLALGFAAGAVRLMPWVFAPEVPLEVALPFARALGAAATETAFLVGAPAGVALVVAVFVERGEARALFALGASPARLVLSTTPHVLAFGFVAALASQAWGSSADVPGRFAVELVAQGRASCARARTPKSAQVPLVNVTWLCFPGQPPRVSGAMPGLGGVAWFTAEELVPSDDLREVRLSALKVFTKKLDERYELEMSVGSATVRGLPGWGRSAKLPLLQRSALAAGTAILLALGAAWSVLALGVTRRVTALALGGLPAATAFIAFGRIDGSSVAPIAYILVPLAGALTLLALHASVRRIPARFAAIRRVPTRR